MTELDEHRDSLEEAGPVEVPAGQLTFVDEVETAAPDETEARERSKEWIGLPMFGDVRPPARAVISFETPEDRQRFFDELGIKTVHKGTRGTLSVWWPEKSKEDLSSLRFVVEDLTG